MPEAKKDKETKAEVQVDNTLSKEAIVAEQEAKLKAAEKAEAEAKAEAEEAKPKDVSFYLLKCRKWRTLLVINKARTEIKGENSVITVSTTDGQYAEKVAFLRKSAGNRANGGTDFVELSEKDTKPGGECLLDSLLELTKESLLNVLGSSDPKNRALSRGSIMMLILKEKGSI